MGALRHLERLLARRLAVELDPQPGPIRRQQVAVLPLDLHRKDIRHGRARSARLLLHADVAGRQVEL